jgi:two-component system, LytTR family, sensor kinase
MPKQKAFISTAFPRYYYIGILGISAFIFILFSTLVEQKYGLASNIASSILVTMFIWIGSSYIAVYLWKHYPWDKNPMKHLLIEVIAMPLYSSLIVSLNLLVFSFTPQKEEAIKNYPLAIVISVLITLLVTSIYEGVNFYRQWINHFAKSVKLERDNLEAKYETLKAQINPHFMFNSLNTLMTFVEENSKASEFVQDLSDFMRYVLKCREKEVVLVREELEICTKYSFIQQSRFGEALKIIFEVPEKYYHYNLPPLVIQMLVENAIKHNVISAEKPLTINVFIEKEQFITVENNLQKKISEASTKLGLANIIERYKFLTPKPVEISETTHIFRVSLPLVMVTL